MSFENYHKSAANGLKFSSLSTSQTLWNFIYNFIYLAKRKSQNKINNYFHHPNRSEPVSLRNAFLTMA